MDCLRQKASGQRADATTQTVAMAAQSTAGIAVIGAGIVDVFCALHLRHAGASPTLIVQGATINDSISKRFMAGTLQGSVLAGVAVYGNTGPVDMGSRETVAGGHRNAVH